MLLKILGCFPDILCPSGGHKRCPTGVVKNHRHNWLFPLHGTEQLLQLQVQQGRKTALYSNNRPPLVIIYRKHLQIASRPLKPEIFVSNAARDHTCFKVYMHDRGSEHYYLEAIEARNVGIVDKGQKLRSLLDALDDFFPPVHWPGGIEVQEVGPVSEPGVAALRFN